MNFRIAIESDSMQVPFTVMGLIIGRNGENLRHLQEIYNVTIRVWFEASSQQTQRDNEVAAGSIMREITIKGRPEMITKTKEIINTVVETKNSDCIIKLQSSRDGFEKVPVPNERVGLVIGKNGATIKDLMSKTCTQIQVPHDPDKDNPNYRSIIITGDPKDVLNAKKQILDIVDGQMGSIPPGVPITTMNVPDDKVGLIIGKKGSIIQDIQLKSKAYIQIPGRCVEGSYPPVRQVVRLSDDPRCISIGGNEEQVEICKKEIQRMIGVSAGTGSEYKEQDPSVWNPIAQMKGLFSGAMDMNQLNQFMQNSGFMGAPMTMQPIPEIMPTPQQPVPVQAPQATSIPQPVHDEEEAPPGMDDEEEAPPGLLCVC